MDTCLVGGISIGNEGKGLVGWRGTDGFIHGNGRGQGIAGMIDVVGRDFALGWGDEKKGVCVFAGDLDVGFVAGLC